MAGASRRAAKTERTLSVNRLVAPTFIASVLALAAVTGYKAIGGVGWPDWWQLLLGPLFVAPAGLIGMAAARTTVGWPRFAAGLSTAIFAIVIGGGGAGAFAVLDGALTPNYQRADQLCEVRARIRYCANPGYAATDRRLAAGSRCRTFRRSLRRGLRSGARLAELPRSGAGGVDSDSARRMGARQRTCGAQVVLGLDVANWTTGVEELSPEAVEAQTPPDCTIDGQARAIVAMWLASRVSPEARDLVAHLDPFADSITGTNYAEAHHGGQVAGRYAA